MTIDDMLRLFESRHSVRSFSKESVTPKELNAVTKAGLLAPCARGIHASHLFVFKKGEDGYDNLIEICQKTIGKDPFYDAPIIILECTDSTSVEPIKDGSAVIENMLLAASAIDLGACWINAPYKIFADENKALLKKIEIPEDYQVIGAIVLGNEAE
jgi:nitroreductase